MALKHWYASTQFSILANSINSEGLEILIQNVMQRRQEKMLDDKRLTIQVEGDLANAILQSKPISSNYLLSSSFIL